MEQILGVVIGTMSGVVWEWLGSAPYNNRPTLIPSIFLKISNKTVHLHHWVLYLVILLLISIWSIRTNRILHPAVLMIIFFLISAMIYGFSKFPEWLRIIE